MPGMNSGINISDPTVVAAFKAALLHQGLIALLIFAVLGLAWVTVRAWPPAAAAAGAGAAAGTRGPALAEPAWRQLLRIGFGLIWIFDGILQAQPKMAVGPPVAGHRADRGQLAAMGAARGELGRDELVVSPDAGRRRGGVDPGRDRHLDAGRGAGPAVPAGRAGQRRLGPGGLGVRRVVRRDLRPGPDLAVRRARRGAHLRGRRGPDRAARAGLAHPAAGPADPGRHRAVPGRDGGAAGLAGPRVLAGHLARPARHPGRHDPVDGRHTAAAFLSAWINAFTAFDEAHGFAVNLFAVAALAVTGAVFLSGRPRLIRPVLIGFTVLCLADWVLIEDFGFLGGLGTDPNSMIPFVLLAVAGYLALARAPAEAAEPAAAGAAGPGWRDRARLARDRVRPQAVRRSVAAASIESVASVGAIGLIVLGAAPMAVAQANPVADTILAQAIDGSSAPVNFPAPAFSLTDQHGRAVTLASLRGKVVLLTFLDDTCTMDCPLIAQEFRQAGQLLAADTAQVELVAINYNPVNTQVSYIQAFDRQEGLDRRAELAVPDRHPRPAPAGLAALRRRRRRKSSRPGR